MPRKKKEERTPRVRRPRERKRREKKAGPNIAAPPTYDRDYWHWLNTRHKASAILNSAPERPYWASIEYNGPPPVSDYYPCTMYRIGDRWYYGFLIRAHRDGFVQTRYRDDARKEYTGADGRSPL